MAKLRMTAGFGSLSGRTGNAVFVRTARGTVLRNRPDSFGTRSPAQIATGRNLALANRAWRSLTDEEYEAWRTYALDQTAPDPETGLPLTPKAYNLFVGLATRYLLVDPLGEVPRRPPTGHFYGDIVQVTVGAETGALRFTASQPNAPGVTTELLVQRLAAPRNAPKPRSYVRVASVAFSAAAPDFTAALPPGAYACATRFVETATGRATALVPIGRAVVG